MRHFAFFLYVFAFSTGAVSLTVSVLFYRQYHKKVIALYGSMLLVVALLVLKRMLELYLRIAGLPETPLWEHGLSALENTAYVLGVFAGPYFCHFLIGLPVSRMRKYAYGIIGGIFALLLLYEVFFSSSPAAAFIRFRISVPFLYGMYLYCMILGAFYLGKLGNRFLNRTLLGVFMVSLASFPFSIYQYFTKQPYLPDFMEYPAIFLMINLFTLFFSFKYFDHPTFFENEHLTKYFTDKFTITDRESEIILSVKKGMSNQEISDKLFISVRTVESHLYTIFQKTNVKNRVQLANLIRTNQKD
jgi:DNA-binding CsgD family transcriptional regulator